MFNISYRWIVKKFSVVIQRSAISNLQRTLYLLPSG
jgi:hypothetical protein